MIALSIISQAPALDLLNHDLDWRSPNRETRIAFKNRHLSVGSERTSNGIYNNHPLNINTRDHDLLIIKMTASKSGIGEVFWAAQDKRFSPLKNYPFYIQRSGTYYLNLSAYNRDGSTIGYLLLFPFSGPGRAEITEFKLVKGNLLEKAMAAWQEFFGPLGREPDGFNFLVIRSPRLFGRPFLLYVNILLGAALIIALFLRRRREFLFLLLACWLLVELSSLLNNWLAFQKSWPFYGQSLEEKHIMLNTKDFYPFLKFADEKLPPGADFDISAAGMDNDFRAQYYLYPRRLKKDAPFLLVFDRKTSGLKPWKTFRAGAFIAIK